MQVFYFDDTFEGLLSCVFDAYTLKRFPDCVISDGAIPPLAADSFHWVKTEQHKSDRVYKGLRQRMSRVGANSVMMGWLSEAEDRAGLLFRCLRKVFDSPKAVDADFSDPDFLALNRLARNVWGEYHKLLGFTRFQLTRDGIYFAVISPRHNVLNMMLSHFSDRFSGQPWIIYDLFRNYGIFHDQGKFQEMTLDRGLIEDGRLKSALLAENEHLFEDMWRGYCEAVTIRERLNPTLQKHFMPKRFWAHMTEKQPPRN